MYSLGLSLTAPQVEMPKSEWPCKSSRGHLIQDMAANQGTEFAIWPPLTKAATKTKQALY